MSLDTGGWGDEPSVLIFANDESGRTAALAAAQCVGARVIGTEPLDRAMDRLARQVAVDAVMIELDEAENIHRDRLIDWADHAARAGSTAPLISLPQSLVDDVYARIDESRLQLLVEPSVEQRAGALGLLLAHRGQALHDHGVEAEAERLRRLSEEVARIAGALAELSSSARSASYTALPNGAAAGDAPLDANVVRGLIRVRRLRDQFFSKELFADPAWDMLLDLMAARLERSRVAVSSLCIAAAVPATTALRWIRTLTEHGLFVRSADPEDGRRIFIELSDAAYDSMTAYFQTLQQVGIRLG